MDTCICGIVRVFSECSIVCNGRTNSIFRGGIYIPINDGATHKAWLLNGLLSKFGTTSAAIGVALFMWITGYLTAMTRDKCSGKCFIMKRFIRLYPGLIMSVIICGIVAGMIGGVYYSIWQYIANALCLYPIMGLGATIGTLWTLAIELLFYLICLHVPKLNFKKIL